MQHGLYAASDGDVLELDERSAAQVMDFLSIQAVLRGDARRSRADRRTRCARRRSSARNSRRRFRGASDAAAVQSCCATRRSVPGGRGRRDAHTNIRRRRAAPPRPRPAARPRSFGAGASPCARCVGAVEFERECRGGDAAAFDQRRGARFGCETRATDRDRENARAVRRSSASAISKPCHQ